MFKDEVVIHVRSGKGGIGMASFRREIFVPKGGPNGGDGGRGGDVVYVGDPQVTSLGRFHENQKFAAENGRPGGSSLCTGKSGKDLVLSVPVGTIVRDAEKGHILKDITEPRQKFVLLEGGAGGRGNARFATAINQTPRYAEKGKPGAERSVRLELKMIAHVGIVGLPNAGKSTFLSRVSKATPRIANYPFTTLVPQLGIVDFDVDRYIFADIPGLIEGAHEGHGLGDRFLRHIERTKILLHLIDCGIGGADEIIAAYRTIMTELSSYSRNLAEKPQVVALSKTDTMSSPPDTRRITDETGCNVLLVSSHSGRNVKELLGLLVGFLRGERSIDS
jgi:GTPase